MSNPYGIIGEDGISPIYNPEGKFTVWAYHEIYLGGPGDERYVPNVLDLVKDMDTGLEYKVVSLDLATLIPVLRKLDTIANGEFTDEDLLLGVGPGTQADTYRVYLDRSVIPYALSTERRLKVGGSQARYARIFRGADLTDPSKIVSMVYDSAGNVIDNRVALEVIAYRPDSGEVNISTKVVPTCHTMQALPDGEVVTAVIYSDVGHVISKRQLLVENTAFISQANLDTKYITHISLECPFLSPSDPNLINVPLNVNLTGLNIMGVVHYSDGSSARYPIDGNKFAVLGLDQYLTTWVDNQVSIVLRYRFSSNEVFYGGSTGEFNHISKTYKLKTIAQDGAYSVKLFVYPVWINPVEGYSLRWYLYNADRDIAQNVTGLVDFAANSAPFNPTQYGVNQRLNVGINLQSVNGSYRSYRHAQTVEIILWRQGTERQTNWTVGFEMGQTPMYGTNNHAVLEFVNTNLYRLNLSLGETQLTEWLRRIYFESKPIVDTQIEITPPTPTHFRLRIGSSVTEYLVEQFTEILQVGAGLSVDGTVFIEFFKRTSLNDLELGVSGLPLWNP